ncbi:MAG: hypothetical protein GX994_01185 [Firmicutes bacterium]|nr:hypothetical protein [Bacillota bacterium]
MTGGGENLIGDDVFKKNDNAVSRDPSIQKLVNEVEYLQKFIDNLSFLMFGRDFVLTRTNIVSVQEILQSVVFTLRSIKLCSENGYVADIYVLIRKYKHWK